MPSVRRKSPGRGRVDGAHDHAAHAHGRSLARARTHCRTTAHPPAHMHAVSQCLSSPQAHPPARPIPPARPPTRPPFRPFDPCPPRPCAKVHARTVARPIHLPTSREPNHRELACKDADPPACPLARSPARPPTRPPARPPAHARQTDRHACSAACARRVVLSYSALHRTAGASNGQLHMQACMHVQTHAATSPGATRMDATRPAVDMKCEKVTYIIHSHMNAHAHARHGTDRPGRLVTVQRQA